MAETEVESFSEPADSDRVAILEVIEQFDHALESGDAEALRRVCLDDFTFFGSGAGEESVGPGHLARMLADVRTGVGDQLVGWDLAVDDGYSIAVRGDGALTHGRGRFRLDLRSGTREGRYLLMYVLHRTADGWKLWAYHGSEPQPW